MSGASTSWPAKSTFERRLDCGNLRGLPPAEPSWTEADQAELWVFVDELLAEHDRHIAEGCTGCARATRPFVPDAKPNNLLPGAVCAKIAAGAAVVIDWRAVRMRASRAEWLRAQLDAYPEVRRVA